MLGFEFQHDIMIEPGQTRCLALGLSAVLVKFEVSAHNVNGFVSFNRYRVYGIDSSTSILIRGLS